jgi:hypothetical protein
MSHRRTTRPISPITLSLAASSILLLCGSALAQTKPVTPATPATPPASARAPEAAPADANLPPSLTSAAFYTPPSERNAALAYYKSFSMMSREARSQLSGVDWDAVGDNVDGAKMPASFKDAAALLNDSYLNQVMLASRMKVCRWESEYEEGIEMLLPYLGEMRATARTMRVAARQAMVEGRPSVAVERLIAMHAIARHAASDPILICSLVGIAIGDLTNIETRSIAASGQLTASARDRLVAHLEALLDEPDLMNARASLRGERDIMLSWVERTFFKEGGPAEFATMMGEMEQEGAQNIKVLSIKALSLEDFKDAVRQTGQFHDDMLVAWDAPDAQERMGELETAVTNGEYGPVAAILAPSLTKARAAATKHRENIKETIEALRSAKVRDDAK